MILHAILDDSFLPGSFIDSQKRAHSLYPKSQADSARRRHLAAYNSVRLSHCAPLLPDHGSENAVFSLPDWIWSRLEFIAPAARTKEIGDSMSYDSSAVAERLYNVTQQLIEDWKVRSSVLSVQQLDLEVELPQNTTSIVDDVVEDVDLGLDEPITNKPFAAILTTNETTYPVFFMKGRLASIIITMKRFSALINKASSKTVYFIWHVLSKNKF